MNMIIRIAALILIAMLLAPQPAPVSGDLEPVLPGIEILDGPGSYIETMVGTVLEVKDANDACYTVVIQPDPEYEWLTNGENVRFEVYDNNDERVLPEPGVHVMMRYPGGVCDAADPLCIPTTFLPMRAEDRGTADNLPFP